MSRSSLGAVALQQNPFSLDAASNPGERVSLPHLLTVAFTLLAVAACGARPDPVVRGRPVDAHLLRAHMATLPVTVDSIDRHHPGPIRIVVSLPFRYEVGFSEGPAKNDVSYHSELARRTWTELAGPLGADARDSLFFVVRERFLRLGSHGGWGRGSSGTLYSPSTLGWSAE